MTDRAIVPAAAPVATWVSMREPFFRLLWIAAFVSNVGTWMQNVGAVALSAQLPRSSLLMALLQTAASLPAFLLSLPDGALAALMDRRWLLLFVQAWMARVALVLGRCRAYALNLKSSRPVVLAGVSQELSHVVIVPARVPSSSPQTSGLLFPLL